MLPGALSEKITFAISDIRSYHDIPVVTRRSWWRFDNDGKEWDGPAPGSHHAKPGMGVLYSSTNVTFPLRERQKHKRQLSSRLNVAFAGSSIFLAATLINTPRSENFIVSPTDMEPSLPTPGARQEQSPPIKSAAMERVSPTGAG